MLVNRGVPEPNRVLPIANEPTKQQGVPTLDNNKPMLQPQQHRLYPKDSILNRHKLAQHKIILRIEGKEDMRYKPHEPKIPKITMLND